MTKTEFIEKLKDWCRRAHQIELTIGAWLPLSYDSTMAFMESQHARMFAGYLLRLAILEDKARTTNYFNPKNHDAHVQKCFDCSTMSTVETILMLKDRLRALLYESIDTHIFLLPEDIFEFDTTEFLFYESEFHSSLKRTDQRLGLLFGTLNK